MKGTTGMGRGTDQFDRLASAPMSTTVKRTAALVIASHALATTEPERTCVELLEVLGLHRSSR